MVQSASSSKASGRSRRSHAGSRRAALVLFDAMHSRSLKLRFSERGLRCYFWHYRRDWRFLVQATALFLLMGLPFFEPPCRDQDAVMPNNLTSCPTGFAAAAVEAFVLLPIIVLDWGLKSYSQGKTRPWQGMWCKLMCFSVAVNVLDLIIFAVFGDVWQPRVLRVVRAVYVAQSSQANRTSVGSVLRTIKSTSVVVAGLFAFIVTWTNGGFPLLRTERYFASYFDSYMNMNTLVTTANFPDIMLPAYRLHPLYSAYFILFLIMALYFGLALVLATVAATYRDMMVARIGRAEELKRNHIAECFKSIDVDGSGVVDEEEFVEVYLELEKLSNSHTCCPRRRAAVDVELVNAKSRARVIFQQVDVDGGGSLQLEEFYEVGDCIIENRMPQLDVDDPMRGSRLCKACRQFREHRAYGWCIGVLGLLTMGIQAAMLEVLFANMPFNGSFAGLWIADWVLLLLCTADVFIGMRCKEELCRFFKDPVNCFDVVVLVVVFSAKVTASTVLAAHPADVPLLSSLEVGGHMQLLRPLLSIRCFHNLRLFYAIPQCRAMLNTFASVGPDMLHLLVNLMLVYQLFGTVGTAAFYGVLNPDNPFLAGSDYDTLGYYDFANFDSWRQATQTMFYLMVVNNWYVLARAVPLALDKPAAVIYFILFWVVCVVMVLSLIMAMFIEMYRFYFSNVNSDRLISRKGSMKDMFVSNVCTPTTGLQRPATTNFTNACLEDQLAPEPGADDIRSAVGQDPPANHLEGDGRGIAVTLSVIVPRLLDGDPCMPKGIVHVVV